MMMCRLAFVRTSQSVTVAIARRVESSQLRAAFRTAAVVCVLT